MCSSDAVFYLYNRQPNTCYVRLYVWLTADWLICCIGYVGVVNRSQEELESNASVQDLRTREAEFFEEHYQRVFLVASC